MRQFSLFIIVSLLAPSAVGLALPRPQHDHDGDSWTDAELMRQITGSHARGPLATLADARGATLPDVLLRVSERASVPMEPRDALAFAALDPRIATPLLLLFVNIEQAWDQFDAATRGLSKEERLELWTLTRARDVSNPRWLALNAQIDREATIETAILLTETIEESIVPQLQAAVRAGAWPTTSIADPVGVLRLGGAGNDLETINRIVQIDARGNDVYRNNAGGTTVFDPLFGEGVMVSPIAISIDFEGDDDYGNEPRNTASMGSADVGIGYGLLLDFAGTDQYRAVFGQSKGSGLGLLRDYAGNDWYYGTIFGLGFGGPLGILRDDAGNDVYELAPESGGFAAGVEFIGLLWDRAGRDDYATSDAFPDLRLGWGEQDGHGWFVDEGPALDHFGTIDPRFPTATHGCNDCTWQIGQRGSLSAEPHGHGNDNAGGLPYLIAYQDERTRE